MSALDRLKALEAAATAGEWRAGNLSGSGQHHVAISVKGLAMIAKTYGRTAGSAVCTPGTPPIPMAEAKANAEFIATARNTYKALLAVAEAAQVYATYAGLARKVADGETRAVGADELVAALAALDAVSEGNERSAR